MGFSGSTASRWDVERARSVAPRMLQPGASCAALTGSGRMNSHVKPTRRVRMARAFRIVRMGIASACLRTCQRVLGMRPQSVRTTNGRYSANAMARLVSMPVAKAYARFRRNGASGIRRKRAAILESGKGIYPAVARSYALEAAVVAKSETGGVGTTDLNFAIPRING